MRISATDIDDGNNGSVHYSLQASNNAAHERDIEYFEVNPDTGEVRLRQKFPDSRHSERNYVVTAVASDSGAPPNLHPLPSPFVSSNRIRNHHFLSENLLARL